MSFFRISGAAMDLQRELRHKTEDIDDLVLLDVLKAHLFFNHAVLIRRRVVAHKPGRDALVERRIRQQVAGKLLDSKPVEWEVAVECSDNPVAVGPDATAVVVVVKPVGISISRGIEPVARAVLTVMRRRLRASAAALSGRERRGA